MEKNTKAPANKPSPTTRILTPVVLFLTALSLAVRLYKINEPAEVVFDEVHFGKFASKYLNNRFFFDVHPPLGKLLIACTGFFSGYDGSFSFEKIGLGYDEVPYVLMRLVSGILGALVAPMAYMTMTNFGFGGSSAILAAIMVIFENAAVTQFRLILLDSYLVFFSALTIMYWSEFNNLQTIPFSPKWWRSLTLIGVSMSLALSVKWVGLFLVATVGFGTLRQLWKLLVNPAVPIREFQRQFAARVITLIVVPFLVYSMIFRIHFAILNKTGSGVTMMTPEFESTLGGSFMPESYEDVGYGSTVTIRHVETRGGYLHSHPHPYPGGSKQQQITCYPHRDKNSDFLVKKVLLFPGDIPTEQPIEGFEPILHGMSIRLEHVATKRRLHSHNERPGFNDDKEINEVTAYGSDNVIGDANDHWIVEIENNKSDNQLKAMKTIFRLKHSGTGCYLMSRDQKLPDWAFGQQEVTCSSQGRRTLTLWQIELADHPNMPEGSAKVTYTPPTFWKNLWDIHKSMWKSNSALTNNHPYDSRPAEWPFLNRGISFWRSTPNIKGIYLLGNPIVWFSGCIAVFTFLIYMFSDLVVSQRGLVGNHTNRFLKFLQAMEFFCAGYLLHYLPFFVMNRQLFLHHYLPASYFGILATCGLLEMIFYKVRKFLWLLTALIGLAVVYTFTLFAPLVYGLEQSRARCKSLKWRSSWDFECPDPNNPAQTT